jgi:hypothetical protein
MLNPQDECSVLTAECSAAECNACPDVDANCCECSCHLDLPEPDHHDEVLCCPDCEHPNQFGELCNSCRKERDREYESRHEGLCGRSPMWDESACLGSMD